MSGDLGPRDEEKPKARGAGERRAEQEDRGLRAQAADAGADESAAPRAGREALGSRGRGSLLPQSIAGMAPLLESGRESWMDLVWREAMGRGDAPAQGVAARRPSLGFSAKRLFEIATGRKRRKGEKEEDAWLFLDVENVSGINTISAQRESNCLRRAWKSDLVPDS